jgi:hypothetical protein
MSQTLLNDIAGKLVVTELDYLALDTFNDSKLVFRVLALL